MQDRYRQAVNGLLSRAPDDAAFPAALAAAYAQCGIGVGLDADALRAYWHGAAGLPDDWRGELARQTCYDAGSDSLYGYRPLSELIASVLADKPPAQWRATGERWVLLLAPLLEPVHLRSLLQPREEDGAPRVAQNLLQSMHAEALAAWAQALIQGQGEWAPVTALLQAQGGIADFARLFAEVEPQRWSENSDALRVLAQLQVVLLLVREHLRINGDAIDADWALGLLLETTRNTHFDFATPATTLADAAVPIAQVLRPLLRAAVRSEWLFEVAACDDGPSLSETLMRTGLAEELAVDEPRWTRLIDTMTDRQLRFFWPTRGLREQPRLAASALYLEQAKWRRCTQFHAVLDSPAALAWYRALLDELVEPGAFALAFGRLAGHADAAARHALIARYLYAPNRDVDRRLLDAENDDGLLREYAQCGNAQLRAVALRRLFRLATRYDRDEGESFCAPQEPYWSTLRALEATQADLLVENTVDEDTLEYDDVERWRALWQAAGAASRAAIAEAVLRAVAESTTRARALPLAETLYADAPELFRTQAGDDYFRAIGFNAAVGASGSPLAELVALASASYLSRSSWLGGAPAPLPPAPLRAALAAYPASFAALEEKHQAKLVPLFDEAATVACAASLLPLATAAGKSVRPLLVALIARTPVAALQRSGLLTATERKARLVLLTGLASNPDPAAADLVAAAIDDKAHDDFSRGLSLDALERAGRSLQGLDDWAGLTLDALQAIAAAQKIPAAAAKAWDDELARLFAPLGEALGRYLLALLLTAEERLPRRVRQILAFLPPAARSDFAGYGVRRWIIEKGSDKFNWLLLPLSDYGDERVANDLVRAVKAWMKTRKPKASAAIRLLARLPGSYGISQVRELWESRKFSESILRNAELALQDAAQRQGLTLEAFLEQLVPDFGLTREGLRLDVGPYAYTARVRGDFSVVVVDAAGKTAKSLPRAKAGEDAQLRGLADHQLKALSKNLKPVFKQQSQRLLRNLQVGKTWSLAQWQRLFVDHPLLAVLSQSVVWSALDAAGESVQRFRPNGSGGLVDAADDDMVLDSDLGVRVAHPLEMPAAERAAWTAQFADYELLSPIGQFEVAVFEAEQAELVATEVVRAQGSRLNRAKFGGLVEKWGYLKGPGEDNAMINEHAWEPDLDWYITLDHSGISVFFDVSEEVEVGLLRPRRRNAEGRYESVPLGELPAALRATLLDQAEALKAAAI